MSNAPPVRYNAAALLLHLIGQALGAKTRPAGGGAMSLFKLEPGRTAVPRFQERAEIRA